MYSEKILYEQILILVVESNGTLGFIKHHNQNQGKFLLSLGDHHIKPETASLSLPQALGLLHQSQNAIPVSQNQVYLLKVL